MVVRSHYANLIAIYGRLSRHVISGTLLFLFLAFSSSSQANFAEITSPYFHINATEKIEYLEDPTGQLKAADLNHPTILKQFAHSNKKMLSFGFTDHTVWLRIELENQLDQPVTSVLHLDRPNMDSFQLFDTIDDKVVQINDYKSDKPSSDSPLSRSPAFDIQLAPKEKKQLFARLSSSHFFNAVINISDPLSYSEHRAEMELLIGLGLGLIACLLIYSLFMGLRANKLYFYFSLYTFTILGYLLTQTGFIGIKWIYFPDLHPKLESASFLLVVAAASYLELRFLKASKSMPYVELMLKVATAACLIAAAAFPFIGNGLSIQIGFVLGMVIAPVMLFALFIHWINGFKPARYYLLSRVVFLGLALFAAQTLYGSLPINTTLSWLLLIALTADVILISFALADLSNNQRSQKEAQQQRIAIADAVTRTKSEFLAQLSHEIRTPMNGILGMAELLAGTPLTHTQQDYLKTVSSSGNHLLKILDDVLDFSKIEAGKMSIDITNFDITSMLTECIELFKTRIEEKQLELITHIDSGVPSHLKGDPIRIRQVLTNLISNAVKFTDHGEIVINIKSNNKHGEQHLYFEVIDTGIGIPNEQLKKLFKSEQVVDPTESKGLGLAISDRLIRMMKGQIGVESQQGKGSKFWFSLPLEAVEAEDRAPILTEKLQGLRLLVVDDNASCRLVIQQQANSWGMSVNTAVNGKQALALLRSQANLEEPFDIVILDHEMPGMNGLELAARIKEDPLINNNLLVIMLTGLGVAPSSTAARNAGIRRVITKPVTGRMLKITLAEELGHLRKIEMEHPEPESSEPTISNKLSILVAEDHHLSQKVIKGMLARLGLECDTVGNGNDAIDAARKKDYSLILMDCEMPDVSGFEATRQIRRWEKANNREEAPIIALTAHIMDEHKERSLECGMNAHLSKPIELSELRDTIMRWTKTQPSNVESINKGLSA